MANEQKTTIATLGLDVNLTAVSMTYLALALIVPIVIWFVAKKYIH